MFITQAYKYELNGIVYVSSKVPEGATIIETMNILNAEEGYTLICKADGEDMSSSLWLKDSDSQDNYIEIKREDENIDNVE